MRKFLLVLFLVGCEAPKPEQIEAEVVQVAFTAGDVALGFNTGQGGGLVVSSTSDQYHLFVRTPDGVTHQIKVIKAEWEGKKIGDKVLLYRYGTGRWKLN